MRSQQLEYEDWYNETKEKIKKAFKLLRKEGFECHMNFWCCSNCAIHALRKDTKKFVFWHQQDTEGAKEGGAFYVGWGSTIRDGLKLMKVFLDNDICAGWDGSKGTRIRIYGPGDFVKQTHGG